MKSDYLAQKEHTLDSWNQLTRFVPSEYMGIQKNTKTSGMQKKAVSAAVVSKGMRSR